MYELTKEQMDAQDTVISALGYYFNNRDVCCYADMSGGGDWWFYDREGDTVMCYPVSIGEVVTSVVDTEDHSVIVYLG